MLVFKNKRIINVFLPENYWNNMSKTILLFIYNEKLELIYLRINI